MLTPTLVIHTLIPNLSFLPDGLNRQYPVRALGCWT